ncbi:metacaspase [Trifolium repens]|nr:metacaspase [Trifolium repens]
MDPLKIEEEKFQFSFEDEMDHPLKIEHEMEPLRNDDTMDLIMEMSNKKRQETLIDLRNCPPRESLRPVYPPFFPACYGAPWGGSGIEIGNNWILDHHVMMMMMPEMSKEKTKKAVLIGLNHPRINNNTDDVKDKLLRMKVKLMELRGFTEDNITLMMDHDQQEEEEPIRKSLQPTQFNIQRTLSSLVHSARRGDILYIHLIAYGCSDGRIITSDKYHIHERFFKGLIVLACKRGYNLTLVSDCLVEPAACSCEEKRTTLFPSLGDDISLEERRKRMKEFLAMKHEVCITGFKFLQPTNLSYVDIRCSDHNHAYTSFLC